MHFIISSFLNPCFLALRESLREYSHPPRVSFSFFSSSLIVRRKLVLDSWKLLNMHHTLHALLVLLQFVRIQAALAMTFGDLIFQLLTASFVLLTDWTLTGLVACYWLPRQFTNLSTFILCAIDRFHVRQLQLLARIHQQRRFDAVLSPTQQQMLIEAVNRSVPPEMPNRDAVLRSIVMQYVQLAESQAGVLSFDNDGNPQLLQQQEQQQPPQQAEVES